MSYGILSGVTVQCGLPDPVTIFTLPAGNVCAKVRVAINIDAGQRVVVYGGGNGQGAPSGAVAHVESVSQPGQPFINRCFYTEEILLGQGQILQAHCWGIGNVEFVVMGEAR